MTDNEMTDNMLLLTPTMFDLTYDITGKMTVVRSLIKQIGLAQYSLDLSQKEISDQVAKLSAELAMTVKLIEEHAQKLNHYADHTHELATIIAFEADE